MGPLLVEIIPNSWKKVVSVISLLSHGPYLHWWRVVLALSLPVLLLGCASEPENLMDSYADKPNYVDYYGKGEARLYFLEIDNHSTQCPTGDPIDDDAETLVTIDNLYTPIADRLMVLNKDYSARLELDEPYLLRPGSHELQVQGSVKVDVEVDSNGVESIPSRWTVLDCNQTRKEDGYTGISYKKINFEPDTSYLLVGVWEVDYDDSDNSRLLGGNQYVAALLSLGKTGEIPKCESPDLKSVLCFCGDHACGQLIH